jgi:signal transduction histidine kinase
LQIRRPVLLAASFTALLLVIGISAVAVWRSAAVAQNRAASLHESHTRAGAALSAIRANVYLTGILTRDYLLDPDPANSQEYIRQFGEIRKATSQSFRVLDAFGHDEQQRRALEALKAEVEQYWDPTQIALEWTPEEKRAHRTSLLRQRVRRRRDIFDVTSQVERLMTANFLREQQRITSADRDFRASIGWITGVALVLGIGIAAATTLRMIKLEALSQAAETELRRLSGQLRTAQENERKYLSRELHDQVGQMLTGIKMELAALARLNVQEDPEVANRLTRAKGTVEQTLRTVRNIAMLLRPSMLDDLGLTPALAWQLKEFSRASGVIVDSEIDPSVDALPDDHRTCIYRIVQEALTNCARHAHARKLTLRLRTSPDSVWVTVSDDGLGFNRGAPPPHGLGLVGIGERVRELNGVLRVTSAPNRGTRIEVRLPRPRQSEEIDDSHPDSRRSRDRQNRLEASA